MDFNSKKKLQKDVSKALKNGKLHKAARNLLVTTIAAGSALGGLAFVSNVNPSANNVVVAAKKAKKAVKKAAEVKRSSSVYNKKGKKVAGHFKTGKTIKVYGTKTIKGKKYYSLGHGKYIAAKNVKLAKTVTFKKTSYVFNSKGKRVGEKTFNKNKKIKVYGTKTIKGKKYYSIGNGKYVLASNTTSGAVSTPTSNGSEGSNGSNSSNTSNGSNGSNSSTGTNTPSGNNTTGGNTTPGGSTGPSTPSSNGSSSASTPSNGSTPASNGSSSASTPSNGSTPASNGSSSASTPSNGSTPASNGSSSASTPSNGSTPASKEDVTKAATAIAKNEQISKGMSTIRDAVKDLLTNSGFTASSAATDGTVVDNINDAVNTISSLPDNWTTGTEMMTKIKPVYKNVAHIASLLKGTGVKTDILNLLEGLNELNEGITAEKDQFNIIDQYFANYKGNDPTTLAAQKVWNAEKPGFTQIYESSVSLEADLAKVDPNNSNNTIKGTLATKFGDIIDAAKHLQGDPGSDSTYLKRILGDLYDLSESLNNQDIKDDIAGILKGSDSLAQNADSTSADLETLYQKLGSLAGNSDPALDALGNIVSESHDDLTAINNSLDLMKLSLKQHGFTVDKIKDNFEDFLTNVKNASNPNLYEGNIIDWANEDKNKVAIKAMYKDFITVAKPLANTAIKANVNTYIKDILGDMKSISNKVSDNELGKVDDALKNGTFKWASILDFK
ncbi:SLAP domain-containing protein [Lactobacillus sp. ESL0785]|uniref:SLAP domain-containing protein n=1 Tax=Lactobacillus sp. ESL0785 TaxID=2983232 RepID=UPI0023FA32D5|nr:SLAP domain-containing protein [Lactobacillus sp. ESL0785]WEV70757.1 SLAP domain-containing protein [Lactobacillus sp. ESL0785]